MQKYWGELYNCEYITITNKYLKLSNIVFRGEYMQYNNKKSSLTVARKSIRGINLSDDQTSQVASKTRNEKELTILNNIIKAMNESYKPEDIYKIALDNIISLEYVDRSCIYIVDDATNEAVMVGHKNMSDDYVQRASKVPYPKGVTWKVINSGEILNVSNAMTDSTVGPAGKSLGFQSMLGIPVRIEGVVKGVFWFLSDKNHHYTEQIEQFLTSIGNQIATAIARANIYYSLEKKKKYEEILNIISSWVHSSVDLETVYHNAVGSLHDYVDGADSVSIFIVQGFNSILMASKGFPEDIAKRVSKIPFPVGFTWKTMILGEPRYVPDSENDTVIGQAGRDLGTKSYLAMPIKLNNEVVGVININSLRMNAFGKEELELLQRVSHQIQSAIVNAASVEEVSRQSDLIKKSKDRLAEKVKELEERYKYEEIVNKITRTVHSSVNVEEIYENSVENIYENVVSVDHVLIYRFEKDIARLEAFAGNVPDWYIERAGEIPYPKGATWKTYIQGESLYIHDTEKNNVLGPAGIETGAKSYLSMPFFFEGEIYGVLNISSRQKNAFDEDEIALLTIVTRQIEVALDKAKQNQRLNEYAEELNNTINELEIKYKYEESLINILQLLGKSTDLKEVFRNAVCAMKENIKRADNVSIYMVENNEAVMSAHIGYPDWFIEKVSRIPCPRGFTWKTILEGKSSYVTDVDKDGSIGPAGRKVGTKSYVSMPINFEDKVVGAININSYSRAAFNDDEMDFLERMKMHVEAAIINAKKAEVIRESELRYRSLVENTSDMIIETDLDGHLIFANKSFCNFAGFGFYDIKGKKIFDFIHEDDEKYFITNFKNTKNINISSNCEFRVMKDRNKWKWVESTFTYAKNKDNKNVVLINFRDISDRKTLEEERLRMQKLDSLAVLAGGIAHDFNNLLSVILGSVSLLDVSLPDRNEKITRYLNDLDTAAFRAKDLTNQLLTFSKGGAPVKEVYSTIGKLTRDTAEFTISGSKSKCEFNIDDDLWLLEIDPGQMSQVIQNLVINADQAMPTGGCIFVKATNSIMEQCNDLSISDGKYVCITIQDQGVGMTKEVMNKIFDPYYTTKSRGSGLGLATVYSIIKNHEGYIFVDSIVGSGTTFTIYLPVTDKKADGKKEGGELIKGSGRVLVMDDDLVLQKVVSGMLEHLGFSVVITDDGEQAIAEFQKAYNSNEAFSLVILDLTVPGRMGGMETQKKLMEIDPDVNTIVSSGYSNDTVLSNYESYGFKGRVSKPYKIDDLSLEISNIMNI